MLKADLTQERLKQLLQYDPETGIFTWISPRKGVTVGSVAGKIEKGYVSIKIDQSYYRAHRLAWLYVYGSFPEQELDHINRIRSDNRIVNLREASRSLNCANKASTTSTGLKGVTRKNGAFQAQIKRGGVNQYLGCFPSAEEAHAAYLTAGGLA